MKKNLPLFLLLALGIFLLGMYWKSHKEPYRVGIHLEYTIVCENGFIYKQTRYGTIQVLNSDGSPLKCGEAIY